MSSTLNKLLESVQKIENNNKFMQDVEIYSDKAKISDLNTFDTTEECREYLIKGIEKGTIKTKEDVYKVLGLKIINCSSGEIIARLQSP